MAQKLELLAWILRGFQRRVIFRLFKVGKMIPAEIYQHAAKINSKITRNSVSDVLREFRKKELVVCLNPSETKGRIYDLTELGKEIMNEF